jgi:hypothetical protein
MCYSLWWTIGSFFAYIALQIMNRESPLTWLTPVYTQWVQVGIIIIIYVFLPESPDWCATRGDSERAKRKLLKLNRDVKGYNREQQYQLLVLTVEHEKQVAEEQKREDWTAIFRGTDGLRTAISL